MSTETKIDMTPEHWLAAAHYLNECVVCGVEHEERVLGQFRSWADPKDGHSLRRRGSSTDVGVLIDKALEKKP
jgi:hypothetical protein